MNRSSGMRSLWVTIPLGVLWGIPTFATELARNTQIIQIVQIWMVTSWLGLNWKARRTSGLKSEDRGIYSEADCTVAIQLAAPINCHKPRTRRWTIEHSIPPPRALEKLGVWSTAHLSQLRFLSNPIQFAAAQLYWTCKKAKARDCQLPI